MQILNVPICTVYMTNSPLKPQLLHMRRKSCDSLSTLLYKPIL